MTFKATLARTLFLAIIAACSFIACGGDGDANGEPSDTTAAPPEATEGPGIFKNVKKGTIYTYDMKIESSTGMTLMGEDMTITGSGIGTTTMTAEDVTPEHIIWMSTANMKMVQSGEGNIPLGDTISETMSMRYTVSPKGELIDLSVQGLNEDVQKEIQQMIQSATGRQSAVQMFFQEGWRNRKEGESWTDTFTDTLIMNDVRTEQGATMDIRLVFTVPVTYTYGGTVDTLGTKAVRIRTDIKGMTMNGAATAEGMNITFDSKAEGDGMVYYSLSDNVQLSSVSRMDMTMTMKMSGEQMPLDQEIPMKQKMTTTMVMRK